MSIKQFAVAMLFALPLTVYLRAQAPTPSQSIISGADIGFRLERVEGGRAIGRFQVRVDGKWLEARAPGEIVPLHTK